MKAFFFSLLVFFFLSSVQAQKVEVLQAGDKYSITSVFFTDSLTGHAVGHDGLIVKTINGGKSWTQPYAVCYNTLRSVFFIDKNNGYAVGDKGSFIRTRDGGLSWTYYETDSIVNLYAVSFPTINKGYAVGERGIILKTSDGGKTWSTSNSGTALDLNSIYFLNADKGFAIGKEGVILKTSDGGKNWVRINPGTQSNLNSMCFLDSMVGFIVGMQGTILKTENGGTDWVDKSPDINVPLISVYFKDSKNGMALDAKRTILKTTDGGNNWQAEDSGLLYRLRSFYMLDANTFYAVTSGRSKILKFTDQQKAEKDEFPLADLPKADSVTVPKKKIVKFGLAFGVANVSFDINNYSRLGDNPDFEEYNGDYSPVPVNKDSYLGAHTLNEINNPGIKIGVISEIKLHDNLRFRMIPGLLFWDKKVYFNVPVNDINRYYEDPSDITNYHNIFSTFIDVPVLFKLQSARIFNKRPYLILGGAYQRNISKSGHEEIIRITNDAYNGEIGIGLNNYFKVTNFTVELKASVGLNNMLADRNKSIWQNQVYSQSIKSLTTNMITLSFMFE